MTAFRTYPNTQVSMSWQQEHFEVKNKRRVDRSGKGNGLFTLTRTCHTEARFGDSAAQESIPWCAAL